MSKKRRVARLTGELSGLVNRWLAEHQVLARPYGVKLLARVQMLCEHPEAPNGALALMSLVKPDRYTALYEVLGGKKQIAVVRAVKKARKKSHKAYGAFYESEEWKELRYRALVKYGARCQCCGRSRADGVVIHVDHIKPRYHFPELELVFENLQVLCADCNQGKRHLDQTDWRDPGQPLSDGSRA